MLLNSTFYFSYFEIVRNNFLSDEAFYKVNEAIEIIEINIVHNSNFFFCFVPADMIQHDLAQILFKISLITLISA